VSLVARHLEANGIPTVVIATARDIVEYCGVARLLFVDFPLGNPCGVPFDVAMQSEVLDMALDLLVTATEPRTTVVAPLEWPGGVAWKDTIFTEEQPFLEGEAYDNWMAAKEAHRKRKQAEGRG
jgi:D-proline reductase (dithiol) PrdB